MWAALSLGPSVEGFASTTIGADLEDDTVRRGALWAAGTVVAAYSGGSQAAQRTTLPDPSGAHLSARLCRSAVRNAGRACWYLEPGQNLTRHGEHLLLIAGDEEASMLPGAWWAVAELVASYTAIREAGEDQAAGLAARVPLRAAILEILAAGTGPMLPSAIRRTLWGAPYRLEVGPEEVADALGDLLSANPQQIWGGGTGGRLYGLEPNEVDPEVIDAPRFDSEQRDRLLCEAILDFLHGFAARFPGPSEIGPGHRPIEVGVLGEYLSVSGTARGELLWADRETFAVEVLRPIGTLLRTAHSRDLPELAESLWALVPSEAAGIASASDPVELREIDPGLFPGALWAAAIVLGNYGSRYSGGEHSSDRGSDPDGPHDLASHTSMADDYRLGPDQSGAPLDFSALDAGGEYASAGQVIAALRQAGQACCGEPGPAADLAQRLLDAARSPDHSFVAGAGWGVGQVVAAYLECRAAEESPAGDEGWPASEIGRALAAEPYGLQAGPEELATALADLLAANALAAAVDEDTGQPCYRAVRVPGVGGRRSRSQPRVVRGNA